jgi:hypothetical protein
MSYSDRRDRAIYLLMEELRKVPTDAKVYAILSGCSSELTEICEETYEWLATLRRFPINRKEP